jgi:sirohydrochlorin ferrochelatase
VLVGCAHGTRGAAGRRTVADLLLAVRAARPDLEVEAAFVDVQPPAVADVVRRLAAAGRPAVVVPLLLSGGYHVHVDVRSAVEGVAGAVAAAALGPDPRLADALVDRLRQAGADDGTAVVLAAAGSSDERAAADVEQVVAALAGRWPGDVVAGFGASATPSVPEAVDALRRGGAARVAVASYLLAPGFFSDRLHSAGADLVTAPLCGPGAPDPRVVEVVLDRYEAATASSPPARAR